ncbi:MAG: cytidine deaminase [Butyribacter sp.]|nr:cytidine deaminase [bacterium]MDY3854675.1 cytidine deaminase [Butyribacter sp.]
MEKNNSESRYEELIRLALKARELSYAPYSDFCVGACLETKSGKLFSGCNIENAGYTATNCAERTAFFKAVSEGEREFQKIAIVGGKAGRELDYCAPCGVCLQVMEEFCNPKQFEIILAKSEKECQIYLLEDLLPMGFGPGNLTEDR